MKHVEIRTFGNPDEVRIFPKGKVELINVGGTVIGRATFEPGWKWSESVKPIVHTETCQAPHFQYHMSGVMVVLQDGVRHVINAGDVSLLPPGHDAWIEGDEPVHLVDFQGMLDYASSMENQVQQISDELRASENLHRTILSSVSDGIIGINANSEITFINPAAAAVLGYTESEMLGKKINHLIHHSYPDGSPFPEELFAAYLTFQDGIPRTVDSEVFWRKDGSFFPVEYSTTPLYQGVALTGIVMAYRDISERKAVTDSMLRAKEAADAANRAKSTFLANMSHELRTPLNAILGFADIVLRKTDSDDSRKGDLTIIRKSGEHLLSIINDILDLSKIEAGKTLVISEDFDLGSFVSELVAMLRVRAEAKGIALRLDQSSSFPRFVKSDSGKLRQILINLVGNAIKFSDSGEVSIKLTTVALNHGTNRIELSFEVTDSGRGISPEDLDKIFNPFEQSIGNKMTEGTGLGLAIAREYVHLLGGAISVTSTIGKGSTFRFTIVGDSVAQESIKDIADKNRTVASIENAKSCRILIVEDNRENRLLMHQLLAPFGFQLREAENGREGIKAAQDWQPDLILMDRRMPVMDGLEATRAIRTLSLDPNPVIVAVTAHAYLDEQQEMLDAGCNYFLRKPFVSHDLYTTIGRFLPVQIHYTDTVETKLPEYSIPIDRALSLPAAVVKSLITACEICSPEDVRKLLAPHPEAMIVLKPLLDDFKFNELIQIMRDRIG